MHYRVIQLSGGSNTENIDDENNKEKDDANTKNEEFYGVKHLYRDECWS
jgi:hypothetical protein